MATASGSSPEAWEEAEEAGPAPATTMESRVPEAAEEVKAEEEEGATPTSVHTNTLAVAAARVRR